MRLRRCTRRGWGRCVRAAGVTWQPGVHACANTPLWRRARLSPQVAAAHPAVAIGSYPNTAPGEGRGAGEEPYKVKLAFTSRDAGAVGAAVAAARAALQVFDLPAAAGAAR